MLRLTFGCLPCRRGRAARHATGRGSCMLLRRLPSRGSALQRLMLPDRASWQLRMCGPLALLRWRFSRSSQLVAKGGLAAVEPCCPCCCMRLACSPCACSRDPPQFISTYLAYLHLWTTSSVQQHLVRRRLRNAMPAGATFSCAGFAAGCSGSRPSAPPRAASSARC
jgi:hypothetical protein